MLSNISDKGSPYPGYAAMAGGATAAASPHLQAQRGILHPRKIVALNPHAPIFVPRQAQKDTKAIGKPPGPSLIPQQLQQRTPAQQPQSPSPFYDPSYAPFQQPQSPSLYYAPTYVPAQWPQPPSLYYAPTYVPAQWPQPPFPFLPPMYDFPPQPQPALPLPPLPPTQQALQAQRVPAQHQPLPPHSPMFHPPMAQKKQEVLATLFRNAEAIAITHQLSLRFFKDAVLHFSSLSHIQWCSHSYYYRSPDGKQIALKFLIHQIAKGSTPQIFYRAKEVGRGTYSTAEEAICVNTGKSWVLKLSLDITEEDPFKVMKLVSFVSPDPAHPPKGMIFQPAKKCEFLEDGKRYRGTIEKYYRGKNSLQNPPRTKSEYKKFTWCMTAVLRHFQGLDVTHDDIKPENIFRDQEDFRLGDWGLGDKNSDLKPVFIERHRKYFQKVLSKGMDENQQKARALDVARSLVGGTPGYYSNKDFEVLRDAFLIRDDEEAWVIFKERQKKREVFSLGATIIHLLDKDHFFLHDPAVNPETVLDLPKQLTPDQHENLQLQGYSDEQLAIIGKLLTFDQINSLHSKGMNNEQVVMIARMVGESAERPNALELFRAFNSVEEQAAEDPVMAAVAAALEEAAFDFDRAYTERFQCDEGGPSPLTLPAEYFDLEAFPLTFPHEYPRLGSSPPPLLPNLPEQPVLENCDTLPSI